jgi:FkbM family methyltransferase
MKWLTDKTPFDKSFEEEPYIESLNPITNPKAGDYCIDAGISKDAMSPLFDFAELVGDRGKIFAFEPDYTIHKYINKEIEERGYKNIKLYSYGIWNEKTKIKFYMQECSSSAVRKVIEDPEYITANFIDIDSFMEENKIERMDVIKMDIEGAEINAIKGAEKTIKKYKPNLIIALYHRKDDAINIINIVHKMNPNYEIFLCYHYPFDYPEDWTEIRNIMLYAIDKNKKKTSK